jgi:hypothetical protein
LEHFPLAWCCHRRNANRDCESGEPPPTVLTAILAADLCHHFVPRPANKRLLLPRHTGVKGGVALLAGLDGNIGQIGP